MALHQYEPGKYTVQLTRSDPMGGPNRRWCKRVAGIEEARKQEADFEAEARNWVAERRLIKEAQARGIPLATASTQPSAPGFSGFLESVYLPWARTNLDPNTMRARAPSLMILADYLGESPLYLIENKVDDLVAKWRAEGCRYHARDKLGRPTNRRPRPISDAGINERLKILRAILGHAHLRARVLATAPRIPLLKKKRAAPGAGEPIRYFTPDERARFLRYADGETADLFQLAVLSGMRPGELFHLLVGSVDLRQKKILVQAGPCPHCPDGRWIPKTGNFRAIDIAPALLAILRRLLKGKPDSAFVIDNEHGKPFSRLIGSGGRFVRTLKKAGLNRKGLSIYSLRHTFAADLITAGRPIQEVAALLGNTPRTCELHYAHLMPGRTAEAVKALKAIEPWPTAQPAPAPSAADAVKDCTPVSVTTQTKVA
jgi:integrase